MSRWALIVGGVAVTVVEQAQAPTIPGQWVAAGNAGPGWLWADNTWSPPAQGPRWITRRSWWNRFPAANEAALRAVVLGASPVVLAGSLARLQARVDSSPYVDLDLAETRDGVAWLSSVAVPETVTLDGQTLPLRLTAQQAAAILDGPIVEAERYRP